jgi:hypothetical protein
VFSLSPDATCSRGDVAELIARLEAERLPNGLAFVSRPPEFDDSLPAVVERRRQLLEALEEPFPAGWDRRTARLRGVA